MQPDDQAALTGFFAFTAALVTTSLALLVMAKTIVFHPDLAACFATYAVPPAAFKPEPLERLLYVSGLLLFPTSLTGFVLLFRAWASTEAPLFTRKWPGFSPKWLWGTGTAAVFAWAVFVLVKNGSFYVRNSVGLDAVAILAVLAAAALATVTFRLLADGGGEPGARRGRAIATLLRALCLTLIGVVALSSIFGLRSVTNKADYTVSFNAVFHAVVQVFQGKALLVDLNHQYGLYPQFLEPLFRIAGLSVLKFTVVMAALSAGSLLFLFWFLQDVTVNKVVRYLGCAALISGSVLFGAPPQPDAYFQYYPLRIVFPSLVVFLLHRALRRRAAGWYYASLTAAALAVLWNPDTGLVVFAAWTGTMVFDAFCRREFRRALHHVLQAGAALVLAYLFFATYLDVRYGSWPRLVQQLSYLDLFYRCGCMMEPMPFAHPWTIVLLVYAAGLLRAVWALVEGKASVRASTVFFLCVMGGGLFSYYQGRSVDATLLPYPAVLVTVLFADSLAHRIRGAGAWSDRLLLAGILFAWTLSLVGLGRNLPGLYANTRDRLARALGGEETAVIRGIAMLKRNVTPGQEVLMLSGFSGIFSLETDTRSPPLGLPGGNELILREDYRRLERYLNSPDTTTVVIDPSIRNDIVGTQIYRAFRIKEYNSDLLLSVLVR